MRQHASQAIEITGVDRHFYLYPLDDPEWDGTEVTVELLPDKLAALAGKHACYKPVVILALQTGMRLAKVYPIV